MKVVSKESLVLGLLWLTLGSVAAHASGIFIPPRPPGVPQPGAPCIPPDSDKCKGK
jgi:hypothetical protein